MHNGGVGVVLAAREVEWLVRPFFFSVVACLTRTAEIGSCRLVALFSFGFELKNFTRFFVLLRWLGKDEKFARHFVNAVKVEVIVRFADAVFKRKPAVIARCGRFLG